MKRKDVYLRAAEIMADKAHPFHCCHAIAKAINGLPAGTRDCGFLDDEYHRRKEEFAKYFQPDDAHMWWWPRRGYRKQRVLALCFMAAISESLHRR